MSVIYNDQKDFCCDAMRAMINESDTTGDFTPICKDRGSYYSLSFRYIYCCPFCGALIINKEFASSKSTDKSFCCGGMEHFCDIEDVYSDFVQFGIFYDAFSRRYYFSEYKEWSGLDADNKQWDMFYCIFCEAKLPESLLDLWLEIVTKEFGVARLERSEKMLPMVPEEYRTDAWWKKRGFPVGIMA